MANDIKVERPDKKAVDQMGVKKWPVWTKEISEFEYHYDEKETCYILEGKVRVEPGDGSKPVEFGPGDLVTFPQGLDCKWKVSKPVRKHYKFG